MLAADRPVARLWFALCVIVVAVALALQIPITAADETLFFTTPAGRVANLFTYFTILSNLLVGVTSAVLALRPSADSTLLWVARFDAVLGVTITAVVHHVLLAPLFHFEGTEWVADQLFHTVSPLLVVAGWLLFGPRGRVSARIVGLALLYPVAWLAFTLVRGAIIGWYPYPFINVLVLGYPRVALNCLGITALFLVLATAFVGLDRLLDRPPRARRAPSGASIEA